MGRVVVIANQKGGVGKTTTAVNLAACLGAAEKRVLLIDIDPQSNATSGVGVNPEEVAEKQIYHVLLGDQTLNDVIQNTTSPNLDLVPANGDLIGYEIEAIDLDNREGRLKQALKTVREHYDVILIDCPPSLGLLTLNALTAADSVLIPLQAEYYALEGLSRLLKTIDLVRQELNPALAIDGIVLTMFDRRNRLSHQVAAEVNKHFPKELWVTRIPRNIRLSEAPSFGQPILLYDIRSSGSQSYLALAKEFLDRQGRQVSVSSKKAVTAGGSYEGTEESIGPRPVVTHTDRTLS